MRHKYNTRGVVLLRTPLGEASEFITLLTEDFGLVRVLAQSIRRPGAKLAPALATFAESSLVLVKGRDGWRITGAILEENWLKRISSTASRQRAIRLSGLLLRLVTGETRNPALLIVVRGFLKALSELSEDAHEFIEILAALRVLSALGLDAGEIPGDLHDFSLIAISIISADRTAYVSRINHGIEASGL
jgi:DNA repair protein RecO